MLANLGDTSTLNEGKQELKGESLGALPCQHPCPNCPGGLLERQCQGVVTAVRVTLVKCADMPLTSPSPTTRMLLGSVLIPALFPWDTQNLQPRVLPYS